MGAWHGSCCQSENEDEQLDEAMAHIFREDWPALALPPLATNRSSRELVRTPTPHHTPGHASTGRASTGRASSTCMAEEFSEDDPTESNVDIMFSEMPPLGALQDRSVIVDDFYDCYDTRSKRMHEMPMLPEVLHKRRPARSSSNRSGFSDTASLSALTPKTRARCEVEVTSRWGILVGKFLFQNVLALATLSSMFVTRIQRARGLKHSTVWRRVESRARRVVAKASVMAALVARESLDCQDSNWQTSGTLTELFTSEYTDTLMILAKAGGSLIASQPILAEAAAPCRVFGDLHGQLRDLLLLLSTFGFPKHAEEPEAMSYVFNGDFVDRGAHSLEVIGILLALKVVMPNRIWLVRGNHEDRAMNAKYGFRDECQDRLGKELGTKTYDLFQEAFDQLPVACLVSGSLLCVHGGVGDGRWDLNDLRAVRRPLGQQELESASLRWVQNILWSDPIEDDQDSCRGAGVPVFGVHDSPRKTSAVLFGWDVTKTFCARNGLGMVVRSHQSKMGGLGFDVMHDDMLVRVFSARDYEGHGNDGAVLLISPAEARGTEEGPKRLRLRPQVIVSANRELGENEQADTLKPANPRTARGGA